MSAQNQPEHFELFRGLSVPDVSWHELDSTLQAEIEKRSKELQAKINEERSCAYDEGWSSGKEEGIEVGYERAKDEAENGD